MTEPVAKHTVHCRNGGKVIIEGDRVEIHLPSPIVVTRSHWVKPLTPHEEARRSLDRSTSTAHLMLEEAFTAVPMHVYWENDDD